MFNHTLSIRAETILIVKTIEIKHDIIINCSLLVEVHGTKTVIHEIPFGKFALTMGKGLLGRRAKNLGGEKFFKYVQFVNNV